MRTHWKRGAGIPRRVDRDQRRATIAEAILRIAAGRGLDEVSLRDVAAEAGVSMGQVQHYFATKSEMLRFACAHMVERTRRAIADALAEAPEPTSARAALRATMTQLLPLDDARRTRAWVWMAFLARGGIDPDVLAAMRGTWVGSHAYLAGQLRRARETGELAPDRDPDAEAVSLLSFADGLVSHVLVGHYGADTALAAIDRYLDRLLTGRRSGPDRCT
jgi:TetR/AcrR family transcriptional repressor of bet genes